MSGAELSDSRDRGMRLRKRRTVLGDISNSTAVAAPIAQEKPQKQTKRARSDDEDDEDYSFISNKRPQCEAPALKKPLPRNCTKAVTPFANENIKPVGDRESKVETSRFHVIKRSIPLHTFGSEPSHCLNMIDKMYNNYYELEEKFSPKPYMSRQGDINQKMRMILVDWIVEIHLKYKLQAQTLWLTVNILDRYLEKEQVLRAKLQLVGVCALLIASKHEEIYPPQVKDCVYVTDYAYSKNEVLSMETTILNTLDFAISIPTGYHFFCRYLNCIKASDLTRHMASYFAERNLQESDMLCLLPHKFAAAAIYAALKQQNGTILDLENATIWTTALQEESGFTANDLESCAEVIIRHVQEDPQTASKRKLIATKQKYSKDNYSGVAQLELLNFA